MYQEYKIFDDKQLTFHIDLQNFQLYVYLAGSNLTSFGFPSGHKEKPVKLTNMLQHSYIKFLDTSVNKWKNKDGILLEAIKCKELAASCAYLTKYTHTRKAHLMKIPLQIFGMLGESYEGQQNMYNWARIISR